jgi:hypothetical protein
MPFANTVQIKPYNVDTTASYTFGNVTVANTVAATTFTGNGSQLSGVTSNARAIGYSIVFGV